MINIAVMGHGTVGSGVLEVFYKNHDRIVAKAGEYIDIKYILDRRDFPGLDYSHKFIKNFDVIEHDPDVRIVVETMGGLHPAYEYVRRCLLAGKSVVTSNKELVAAYGDKLLDVALKNNLNFLFEASVGGGIPIIRPLSQCLAANNIIEIAGILNGTTNFILTKMITDHMGFGDALKLAQQNGFAERDPAADVEGLDACRKICILASLVYGRHVYPKDVHTEGISRVSLQDVRYAAAWGGVIKLIARVKRLDDGRLSTMVSPAFLKKESQLAGVDGVFNGILVRGDATGDVVFYGRGAGKLPTASAVVADVIDCVKHMKARKYLYWKPAEPGYVVDYRTVPAVYFVRAKAADPQSVLDRAKRVFGAAREIRLPEPAEGEAGFLTPERPEGELEKGLGELGAAGVSVASRIRVLDF